MGLKSVQQISCLLLLLCIAACAGLRKEKKVVVKFYYDCCSPSLQRDAKEACKVAQQFPNNTITDENGDKHIFIWSDCKPGEEPWRKWE